MNVLLNILIILCIDINGLKGQVFQNLSELPKNGYQRFGGNTNLTWKLHLIPATWNDARLRCYFEGGVLASPVDEISSNGIKQVLEHSIKYIPAIFTGIHDTFSKGDYTSIEGIPLSMMNTEITRMSNIYFSNETNKNCLVLNNNDYSLSGKPCTNLYPYICFKNKFVDNRCRSGMPCNSYQYETRTGSSYKVHTEGQSWERAYMACAAEDAHLVIVNSQKEAQIIKELLEKYPKTTMQATYTHVASVGFHNWGEKGSWWTIQGESLPDAGYAIWDTGAPDSRDTQFCGGINRSGKFNDVPCNSGTLPFICEKELKEII